MFSSRERSRRMYRKPHNIIYFMPSSADLGKVLNKSRWLHRTSLEILHIHDLETEKGCANRPALKVKYFRRKVRRKCKRWFCEMIKSFFTLFHSLSLARQLNKKQSRVGAFNKTQKFQSTAIVKPKTFQECLVVVSMRPPITSSDDWNVKYFISQASNENSWRRDETRRDLGDQINNQDFDEVSPVTVSYCGGMMIRNKHFWKSDLIVNLTI